VEDNSPSASTGTTSLVTPCTEKSSRRRVSGIHILQTLVRDVYLPCVPQLRERTEQRYGNFGTARLRGVAALNIQRLVYQRCHMGRHHLTPSFRCHPAVSQPICLRAACTLDDILAIVPRHLSPATSDLQVTVQHRMLDVLAQQIVLGGLALSSTAVASHRARAWSSAAPDAILYFASVRPCPAH